MTWKRAVAEELARVYTPGQRFTLSDFYAKAEDRLQARYPANTTVRDTMRQIMQRLRDQGLLEFHGNGVYTYRGAEGGPTSRSAPRSPLAEAVWNLAREVTRQTKNPAPDYVALARSDDGEVGIRRLVQRGGGTFAMLYQVARLDLSLEQFVVELGATYGLDPALVDEARGKLDYWTT